MKKIHLLSFLVVLCGARAFAAPVMNLNAPGAESVTAFPDHRDSNLYYLAPTVMLVAKGEDGVPAFGYSEYRKGMKKFALLQATLKPYFDESDFGQAKAKILKSNPKAVFTGLPFIESRVLFGDLLGRLIESSECNHHAGVLGEEQVCSFILNSKGVKVFRAQLSRGLTLTLELEFVVDGVVQNPNGSFEAKLNTYRVAGRIGSAELAKYPQLFQGTDGKPLTKADLKAK